MEPATRPAHPACQCCHASTCHLGAHPPSLSLCVRPWWAQVLVQLGVCYDVGGREYNEDRYTAFSVSLSDGRRYTVAGVRELGELGPAWPAGA